jgi:hypothetical protein
MYSRNIFLIIFQTFGFYPNRIFKNSGISIGILLTVLNFCIVIGIIVHVGWNQDTILYSITPIGKINDILVLFSLYFTHLAIIVESFLKRKYFSKFWNHQKHVEKFLKVEEPWQTELILKSIFLLVFTFSVELSVILNISSDTQWTIFWFVEIFSLLCSRLRHFQEIFFVEIIFSHLRALNKNLFQLILWTKSLENENLASKHFTKKLKSLRNSYSHLMTMIIYVNKIFCWSQVLNFCQNFIEITSNLYWLYVFACKTKEFLWRKFLNFMKI